MYSPNRPEGPSHKFQIVLAYQRICDDKRHTHLELLIGLARSNWRFCEIILMHYACPIVLPDASMACSNWSVPC